jgi:hypothetical protein
MKKRIRTFLTVAAALCLAVVSTQGDDRLKTSPAELERLKELNKTDTGVSQSDEELRKLMVGKWATGRHEYLYRADGTWQMLPVDISSTNGKWKIQNRQLIEEVRSENRFESTGARTFIEVTPKQLVLRNEDGPYPYRYIRIE